MTKPTHDVDTDKQFLLTAKQRGFTSDMREAMLALNTEECWQQLFELGLRAVKERDQRASMQDGKDSYIVTLLTLANLKCRGIDTLQVALERALALVRTRGMEPFNPNLEQVMEKVGKVLCTTKSPGLWLAGMSPEANKLLAWDYIGKGVVECKPDIHISGGFPCFATLPANTRGFVVLTKQC